MCYTQLQVLRPTLSPQPHMDGGIAVLEGLHLLLWRVADGRSVVRCSGKDGALWITAKGVQALSEYWTTTPHWLLPK